MHIFLKAARRPGSNVNEQFSCDTGAGKIYCGSSNFPLNERTAALFQNGDKILDVAHRAGSWPEMASFRELIRQLGGQAANLFQHEVDECNLTAPPSPQTVADDSVLLGCSPTRPTLMRSPPVTPEITYADAVQGAHVDPHAHLVSMDAEPAPALFSPESIWTLALPNAHNPAGPPVVSSLHFPFDPVLRAWRCEIPSAALANPCPIRLTANCAELSSCLHRLDVEAYILPFQGAADGADPWSTYLVASISPANNSSSAEFAVSWLSIPAMPHAVVLFLYARPEGSFVTKPMTDGRLDAQYVPPQKPVARSSAVQQGVGQPYFATPGAPQANRFSDPGNGFCSQHACV